MHRARKKRKNFLEENRKVIFLSAIKNNMNQEKQRIKIAEACGWTVTLWPSGEFRRAESPNGNQYFEVPDYLSDLNAMHEAESHLRNGDWTRYCQYLAEHGGGTVRFASVHASAQTRAIAFLKTLNLWEQETK